jgi:oxygen-independent coproporphyrinogen-3 oxidase
MGIDQVAAYPLFRFPYTAMRGSSINVNYGARTVWKRRKMLRVLERIFDEAGFERTSVWAFTRKGVSKYCSVTVPLYLGLGASGGSYLKDIFYINTFNVAEYIQAIESKGTAVALSLELTERMRMAGWLYWRIYETRFSKLDFQNRFGKDFDTVYGKYLSFLRTLGFLQDNGERVVLTDRGSYWLHAFEDLFSIEYISRLWGTAEETPWPESVRL